ncbi:TetR/AcrR family transcriptional repressor of uid operon [Mesorhizobium soli]|uniref:TetR/AcrR family transcriptional regulator n=1 Tax=Pseudaminobacter soli (ex Li et al. 2025) TaxID=1295366 RepID=UPI0024761B8D|nr:TetR/AcrR family transcriptional regulator [Mesorhizobium soli]MDH6234573.1 TetR/AcrR family transcriptional repressor of uid operon [Mesorhizobium soli]
MRTVDPDKHAAQRQVILSAAKTCFARNGFHKTSTEAICAEAGTSSGKLFHYFPNKKAIILAVVEDQARQTTDYFGNLLEQPDLSAALSDFFDVILHLASDAEERRLILEIAAEAARDEDVGALNAKGDRLLAEGLTALLTEATSRGQVKPVVPVGHAVRFLMVMIDGIFSRVSVDAAFDPAEERASLQTILRSVLRIGRENAHA